MTQPTHPRSIILITGIAGAGLNTARTTFEDMGYEVVDNPPLDFVDELLAQTHTHPLALGIDSRTRGFSAERVKELLKMLNERPSTKAKLLFLDCADDLLLQRFSETRRRHPLAVDRPIEDGLALERAQMEPLKNRADVMLDTSQLSAPELRKILQGHFPADTARPMLIEVMSFSFRHGVPREADMVFDARFLRNPHYDPLLRPRTGQEADVGAYVAADPAFEAYFAALKNMITAMQAGLKANSRPYFTIAFGCTGGKHRSVYLTERTAHWLQEQGHTTRLRHRELMKNNMLKK